jgi:hypothetical protein
MIALAAFLFGAVTQAMAQGAFYEASEAEIANGLPGSVIRDEPMGASPRGRHRPSRALSRHVAGRKADRSSTASPRNASSRRLTS